MEAITQRYESATRYYVVHCAPDLFGEWLLSRFWGGKDSRRGGERHMPLADPATGIRVLQRIARVRARRGYWLVAHG